MTSHRRAVVLVALLLCACAAYAGSITYTYTGKDFTVFASPYTSSESIDLSLTFSAPLGDNLVNQPVTPLSETFSDGNSADDASSLTSEGVNVNTDASGDITEWVVAVDLSDGNFVTIESAASYAGNPGDTIIGNCAGGICAETGNPGMWGEPSSTPEPASANLIMLGLAAFGVWRLRRAQSPSASNAQI